MKENLKFFYHLYSHKIYFYLFLLTLLAQIFFWKKFEQVKPEFDIIPPPPSKIFISAASLGDKEFLFRSLSLRLQNAGDIFVGFVSLKKYDYSRLYKWMSALDELNYESNLIPSLAAYYYSQTQNKEDVKYMVQYLDEHANKDLDQKWWWLFQSVFIAKKNLQDQELALELAKKLAKNNSENAPLWTKQMPAFIYQEMGNACLSFKIIESLIKEHEAGERKLEASELNFMKFFIKNRLSKLKKDKFNPLECK